MRRSVLLAMIVALAAPSASAQLPVSGRPVPALSAFDSAMQSYMDEHDITAGVLGVMAEGRIVYLRGFGSGFSGAALPENALWRIASLSKPITAAAVRRLIATNPGWNESSDVFDVGQAGGGILDYAPFPSLGDNRFDDITVDHLLRHRGGWDRSVTDDVTYREVEIADDMDVASPPGRVRTMRWILGQPLDFAPGSRAEYSNVGMLALGLVVEQESGQSLVDFVRQNVLTPAMWVPSTEILRGRTFRDDQSPREPLYESALAASVFDNQPGPVPRAYGGWDHEARIGQGGYVTSAASMLTFLDHYHVGAFSADIGQPIGAAFPRGGDANHNGAFSAGGLNSFMVQRADGVNVFVVFNLDGDDVHFGTDFYDTVLEARVDAVDDWPETTSDGFWTDPDDVGISGVGGYHAPFSSFGFALAQTTDGSKLRLRPGSGTWTGVLSERMLLDAPLGAASLGN